MVPSRVHVLPPGSSLIPPILPLVKHHQHTTLTTCVNRVREPLIRTTEIVRAGVPPLLYAPDTPISYNFHSCSTSLIRSTLSGFHEEDAPPKPQLASLTFSLPKKLDDNGLAMTWLVSLAVCLAWCIHATSSNPEIIITEPEFHVGEPDVAVNETEPPSLIQRIQSTTATNSLPRGADAGVSTTATSLVTSFLEFSSGLPADEMAVEEQVIFALADFMHARADKCKTCILWRSVWKECLKRIYGAEVVQGMVRERKFEIS